ncbi:hypothetical protein QUF72_17255 [Desulfobacterales bacterium HSG2]|nr:hypothetical protein [Desulfobacterales bacterium HSG2]
MSRTGLQIPSGLGNVTNGIANPVRLAVTNGIANPVRLAVTNGIANPVRLAVTNGIANPVRPGHPTWAKRGKKSDSRFRGNLRIIYYQIRLCCSPR